MKNYQNPNMDEQQSLLYGPYQTNSITTDSGYGTGEIPMGPHGPGCTCGQYRETMNAPGMMGGYAPQEPGTGPMMGGLNPQ
ncbi:hypothetical protein, partial [Bacillus timonensis]|uniref:hypothetical protein n=1 Tax=Bacillus timonensis TaxID=1033734 RepID=UPI0002896E8A